MGLKCSHFAVQYSEDMPNKYDDFRSGQANSIDGFLAGPPGQRPRRPQIRRGRPIPSAPPRASTLPDIPAPPVRVRRAAPMPGQVRQLQPSESLLQDGSETYQLHAPAPLAGQQYERRRPAAEPAVPPARRRWFRKKRAAAQADRQALRRSKSRLRRAAKVGGILVLLVGLGLGVRFYNDIARLTSTRNPLKLLNAFQPVELKNTNGRVNMLVAGNSADDFGHEGGELTDSIMVLSLNTKNDTAMMLSIPRDLWVKNPSGGYSKINAVYPAGGMDALRQVVEGNLELPIHYEALVNYRAFKDLVDAVGGIDIKIESEDPRGIYDPSLDWTSRRCCALAKYPNGPVTLNGKQALNLARARGDAYGSYGFPNTDFDRTANQRKMLLAIKAKASSPTVIANPFKVSDLVSAVSANVRTDLQLNEMQTMYVHMKKIDDSKIDSYNLNTLKGENTTMLANYTGYGGQSALIPAAGLDDFSEIAAQIKRLFSASPVAKEAANVVVLNATETPGLARTKSNDLIAQGMSVLAQGNAVGQPTTTIVDNSQGKKPNTLAQLKKLYSATVVDNATLKANYPSADFVVILGETAAPKPATGSAP